MATDERDIAAKPPVEFGAALQSSQAAKTNGHAKAASATNMGSDFSVTEDFPWRPEGEGKAPIHIKIRPHVLSRADLEAIDDEVERVVSLRAVLTKKRGDLIERRIELRAELDIEVELDGIDEKDSDLKPRLDKINAIIERTDQELAALPTPLEVRAAMLIVPVVASWPLTYVDEEAQEEKIIPIEAKAIAREINPVRFNALYGDLQNFMYRDRSKKKR